MQLRRDHASDAHGALTDQREQRAVRIHEAEQRRLPSAADACGDRVQGLDERGDHEAVAPCLEGLDESIGEHPAAGGGTDEIVGEPVGAPANRCAGRRRVEACHAGILRATQDFPVEARRWPRARDRSRCASPTVIRRAPSRPGSAKWRTRIRASRKRAATAAAVSPGEVATRSTKFACGGFDTPSQRTKSIAQARALAEHRARRSGGDAARSSSAAIAPAIAQRSTGYESRTALRSAISERSPSA